MKFVKKRAIGALLSLVIAAGASVIPITAEAAGEIHISTQEELLNIKNNMSGSYILDNDITITGTWPWSENRFTGTFNGNGYAITVLNGKGGLFGFIDTDGVVKNVTVKGNINGSQAGGIANFNYGKIENCISYVDVNGSYVIGGIAGVSGGTISRCVNYGTITGTSDSDGETTAGGIAGSVSNGTVESCCNIGTVKGTGDRIGGIAGFTYYGNVSGCYNTGSVHGVYYVGGIVGYNEHSVNNCYNTGYVQGDEYYIGGIVGNCEQNYSSSVSPIVSKCYNIGGVKGKNSNSVASIVGEIDSYTTVTDCYYLAGQSLSGMWLENETNRTTALTADQFMDKESFSNWDFNDIWGMSAERPILRAIPELELLREPATASAVKLDEYSTNTDTGKKASAWKVTVTPGTDAITNLNVRINNTPANETEGIPTPKISGGAVVFGIVVNILGNNDVTSVTAVVNGEDIAANIE